MAALPLELSVVVVLVPGGTPKHGGAGDGGGGTFRLLAPLLFSLVGIWFRRRSTGERSHDWSRGGADWARMEKQGWEIYGRMAGARVGARVGRARPEKIFPSPHRICGRNVMSPSAVSSAYQGLGNGAGLVSSGRNLYPLSPLQFLATSPQKLMCHLINVHETLMTSCTGNSLSAFSFERERGCTVVSYLCFLFFLNDIWP